MSEERPRLVVIRAARMTKVHPKTDFTHVCALCREQVGIFPSGQQLLRDQPNAEIVCDRCAGDTQAVMLLGTALPGVRQEMREAVDFTKKKPS